MKHKLRKDLAIGILCFLMLVIIPTTIGLHEKNKPSNTICDGGDYNLVQQLNPTRRLFPRIYLSGSIVTLDAYVINEGPDNSSDYTLELRWTRIFPYSGVLLDVKVGEYEPIRAGYRRHKYINLECYGGPISIFKVHITNTADDLDPDDNTASFIYIVYGL